MRCHGEVDTTLDLGPSDHLCWSFEGHEAFRAGALAFLADGLALGLRVGLVAPGTHAGLRADLADLGDVDALIASGALTTTTLDRSYRCILDDPDAQVAAYAAATRAALDDGFAGLRVAADVSELVAGAVERDAFVRYEHRIDRYMRTHPFSALCGYDRARLGADAVAELASAHPVRRRGASAYGLFTGPVDVTLTGNVDAVLDRSFEASATRLLAGAPPGPVAVDCTDLEFLDHHGLALLERVADDRRLALQLHGAPRTAATLVAVMGLAAVSVVAAR